MFGIVGLVFYKARLMDFRRGRWTVLAPILLWMLVAHPLSDCTPHSISINGFHHNQLDSNEVPKDQILNAYD